MRHYSGKFLVLWLLFTPPVLFAQDKPADVPSLIKEGQELNKEHKFIEAAAKFDEGLKIDPANTDLLEDKGTSLALATKYDDALQCFEKVVAVNSNKPYAYVSMANIYSMRHEFDKGIYYYSKAIGMLPREPHIWNSLSSDYFLSGKFAQAQAAAIEAIKLDLRKPGNYQFYAYAALSQGKLAEYLLGICNLFIVSSPKDKMSTDAYRVLKSVLRAKPKPATDAIAKMQQQTFTKAITAATAGKTNLTSIDSLTLQLTSAFKAIKAQQDQYGSPFFSKYFGDFFGEMDTTDYMETFAHLICLNASIADNEDWLKGHPEKVTAFVNWLNNTKRETE